MKNLKVITLAIVGVLLLFAFKPSKDIIVIDAGHGGKDLGGIIDSHVEKDIVREIGLRIKNMQNSNDYEIVLLREDDQSISLADRVAKINSLNPKMVISIHIDQAIDRSSNGVNASVSQNAHHDKSLEFANKLLEEIASSGLKKGKTVSQSFFVIKHSNCPAVNLQLGNLANADDREFVAGAKGQTLIAESILRAIGKY